LSLKVIKPPFPSAAQVGGLTQTQGDARYPQVDGSNLRVFRGTTAPSSPAVGQIWEDTNTTPATLKHWNGTAWASPRANVIDGAVTDTSIALANKDGTSSTPSMRTLGTGATQAVPGTHSVDVTNPHNVTAAQVGALTPAAAASTYQTPAQAITQGDARYRRVIAPLAKAANYTAAASDEIIIVDTTGGAVSITLPTAVGITGKFYGLKNIGSAGNTMSLLTTSSQTIDGFSSLTTNIQNDAVRVVSDGANWWIS
jgi:hypothetical protein